MPHSNSTRLGTPRWLYLLLGLPFGLSLLFLLIGDRRVAAQSTEAGNSDWLTYNGSYAGDRYSSLKQITTQSVGRLEPLCTFDTGENTSFQTGPLAIGGILYFTTYSTTYAVDGSTCALKWKATRSTPPTGLNVNRGVAFSNGRLFRGTGDAHVLALDAASGKQLWDVAIGDPSRGESAPLAPIAWNGMVFVGNAGGDNFGVTGRIYALSAEDGHVIWQFDTVPQSGPARNTWLNVTPENPPTGGATWTTYSLDTTGGILYASTGNVAPDFVEELHPGDNLYTTSIVALDAKTGQLTGFIQPTKGDFHDWDIAAAPAVVTTRSGRQLVAAAGKDGILYGIDRSALLNEAVRAGARRSGQVAKFGTAGRDAMNVGFSTAVTTRENVDTPLSSTQDTRFCPGTQGGVEWNGPAYHPGTNMLYTNGIDWCTTIRLAPRDAIKGQVAKAWTGAADPAKPFGKNDSTLNWGGWITGVDADSGQIMWRYQSPTPMIAGVTATAGGLLVTGDLNGVVLAFDAATGRTLWQYDSGQPIGGGVITYANPRGSQLLAVAAAMRSSVWPTTRTAGSARILVFGLP